jgi:methyl-accepting chemotaxis protein
MEVLLASAGIILVAIVFWFRWNPSIVETTRDLAALRRFFDQAEPTGKFAIQEANRKTSNPNVKAILAEVESGLFELPGDLGIKTYSLRFYQEIWTPRSLLAKKVNLALYDAAPNILIGIGLLFTFIFLALALADVMPALAPQANPDEIKDAISGLLKNAAGKFLTSICGMSCSILWTFFSKKNLDQLEVEIEALCISMQRHVEDTGSEAAISAQISILGAVLDESREQVGQLRRFETDFAVAIGNALGSQMQPAFESLTASITGALNKLTEKVGSMNEDALKKMLVDFQSAIKEHSGKEMESFRQTLVEIADSLKEAAKNLETAGSTAGNSITEGGKKFTDDLANGAVDLKQAANLLESAMVTAKATVNDMDETLERATASGRIGIESLESLTSRLKNVVDELSEAITSVNDAGGKFKEAATETVNATENLQGVIDEQSNLVKLTSDAASSMEGSLTVANKEFRQSAEMMKEATNEIGTGIQTYTKGVSELHIKLDQNLAKAIGSLNGAITELTDGLEDFLEEFRKENR